MNEKYHHLLEFLRGLESALLAFSGGADSSLLLYAGREALGNNLSAVTVKTPYMAEWEIEEAVSTAQKLGINHQVLKKAILPDILHNPTNRCYLCKKHLFLDLLALSRKINRSVVIEGTNADDTSMDRPGLLALKELGIISPLKEVGLTKAEVREISLELGLDTHNKPSYACLLTRLPCDTLVDTKTLRQIEKAEVALFGLGFKAVRVRVCQNTARIEVEESHLSELLSVRKTVVEKLKELGFKAVTLDLEGYQYGGGNK